jgi:hypothetical protein
MIKFSQKIRKRNSKVTCDQRAICNCLRAYQSHSSELMMLLKPGNVCALSHISQTAACQMAVHTKILTPFFAMG